MKSAERERTSSTCETEPETCPYQKSRSHCNCKAAKCRLPEQCLPSFSPCFSLSEPASELALPGKPRFLPCGTSYWSCSVPTVAHLHATDRLLWVWLSRLWTGWRSALVIVKPKMVIASHRLRIPALLEMRRHREGRPTVSQELRDLIRRMSLAKQPTMTFAKQPNQQVRGSRQPARGNAAVQLSARCHPRSSNSEHASARVVPWP